MTDKKAKKPTQKDKISELTHDLQRVQADFDNYRRRAEEERSTLSIFAKKQSVLDFLPILDNLERAVAHVPKELKDNEWAKGVEQVAKQIQGQLEQLGIKRIPTVGEEFDPNLHEAISMDEGEGKHEIISAEIQPGYVMDEEVIRHAVVKVKKHHSKSK